MLSRRSLAALAAVLACAACGAPADPSNAPPDAGPGAPDADAPDVPDDGPTDPPPDVPVPPPDVPVDPPPADADHDGHPDDTDCDDADPARWQLHAYSFRDADGDGHTRAELGSLCAGDTLPPGYATTPGPSDCDDADPMVFELITGFLDGDGDRVGVEPPLAFCARSLPAGFVPASGDCEPADASRWQRLVFSFRDGDGDGAFVDQLGAVCSGAALPPGFLERAPADRPRDCDDADPAVSRELQVFRDLDLDGLGAGPGTLVCTGGTPPLGFSLAGTDCDDADPARARFAVLYPDGDGDGVGAPPRAVRCLGATRPAGFAIGGYDEDDADPAVIEADDFADLLQRIL